MFERIFAVWWVAGAGVFAGLGGIIAVGHLAMTVLDHRRHRHWTTTFLAMVWPVLSVAMIGVLQGNMAPPLFGVPLLILFLLAWARSNTRFAVGVWAYYLLSTLVVVLAGLGESEIRWWFLVFWPASLLALKVWRSKRMSALEGNPAVV